MGQSVCVRERGKEWENGSESERVRETKREQVREVKKSGRVKVRMREREDTHTHTHTHRERERERDVCERAVGIERCVRDV